MAQQTFMYFTGTVPHDYYCSACGVTGCKLWRTLDVHLVCCECATRSEGRDANEVDARGTLPSPVDGQRTDQIGWCMPAVPTPDNSSCWGYTSTPDHAVAWWRNLPTRAPSHPLVA